MAEYRISGDTLRAIADRTRAMAGTDEKMTPAEIIYWLGRVKFTSQGWADSEFTATFSSGARGTVPTVYRGNANSEFTPVFTSSAAGALQEE